MVENQHGRDLTTGVQTQHIRGPIDQLVDTHHGEGVIKKIEKKENQGEPFRMKGLRWHQQWSILDNHQISLITTW